MYNLKSVARNGDRDKRKPSLSYYLLFTDATDLFTRFYWGVYSLYN